MQRSNEKTLLGKQMDKTVELNLNDITITKVKELLYTRKLNIDSIFNLKDAGDMPSTFLCMAAWRNDQNLIDYLKYLKVNVKSTSLYKSAFAVAARYQNVQIFQKLHQLGADVDMMDSSSGESALIVTVIQGNYEIAKYLIDHGADVNRMNPIIGMTPLHYACRSSRSNPKVVELLLDNNAIINAKSTRGEIALELAVLSRNIVIAKLLIARGAHINYINSITNQTIMFDALDYIRDVEFLEYLIALDEPVTDINISNGNKENLLHYELQRKDLNERIINLLFDSDIDANAKDSTGERAVDYYNRRKRFRTVYVTPFRLQNIKLIAAGLPVRRKHRKDVEFGFEYEKNSCFKEVQKMKIDKIGVSSSAFLDTLLKSPHYLTIRLKFAGLDKVVDKEQLSAEYPQYGGMIFYRLSKVQRRIKYLEQLEYLAEGKICRWGLPYDFVRELWSYFTNIELKKLITVLKC